MSDLKLITLGEVAYTSYRNSTGGKTWNNYDMPTWEGLTPPVRAAWEAAGVGVRDQVLCEVIDSAIEQLATPMTEAVAG